MPRSWKFQFSGMGEYSAETSYARVGPLPNRRWERVVFDHEAVKHPQSAKLIPALHENILNNVVGSVTDLEFLYDITACIEEALVLLKISQEQIKNPIPEDLAEIAWHVVLDNSRRWGYLKEVDFHHRGLPPPRSVYTWRDPMFAIGALKIALYYLEGEEPITTATLDKSYLLFPKEWAAFASERINSMSDLLLVLGQSYKLTKNGPVYNPFESIRSFCAWAEENRGILKRGNEKDLLGCVWDWKNSADYIIFRPEVTRLQAFGLFRDTLVKGKPDRILLGLLNILQPLIAAKVKVLGNRNSVGGSITFLPSAVQKIYDYFPERVPSHWGSFGREDTGVCHLRNAFQRHLVILHEYATSDQIGSGVFLKELGRHTIRFYTDVIRASGGCCDIHAYALKVGKQDFLESLRKLREQDLVGSYEKMVDRWVKKALASTRLQEINGLHDEIERGMLES